MNNEKVIKEEKKISNAFVGTIFCMFLVNYTYLIKGLLPIDYDSLSMIIKAVPVLLFFYSLTAILNRLDFKGYATVFFVCLLLGISILFRYNKFLKDYVIYCVTVCLPCGILAYCIRNTEVLVNTFKKPCYVIAVLCTVFIFYSKKNIELETYYMGFTNSLSLFIYLSYYIYLQTKKYTYLGCVFIILITILSIGSRGVLIGIAVYILYSIYRKKGIKALLYSVIMVIALVLYRPILSVLNDFISILGFESRTLRLLATETFHDSGRRDIQEKALTAIYENVIEFRGVASDMKNIGTYPHNIFIEIVYQFGTLIGVPFSLYILYLSLKTFFSKVNCSELQVILWCSGVAVLFVSSTLWKNLGFWIWLFYAIKRKNEIKSSL